MPVTTSAKNVSDLQQKKPTINETRLSWPPVTQGFRAGEPFLLARRGLSSGPASTPRLAKALSLITNRRNFCYKIVCRQNETIVG